MEGLTDSLKASSVRTHKEAIGKIGSQKERREKILKLQKDSRRDAQNIARRIVDFTDSKDSSPPLTDCDNEEKKNKRNPYCGQLMLSEWMEGVPMDFRDCWLGVACPVGKRCLVISSKGRTNVWLRNGKHLKCFQALLPAGECLR